MSDSNVVDLGAFRNKGDAEAYRVLQAGFLMDLYQYDTGKPVTSMEDLVEWQKLISTEEFESIKDRYWDGWLLARMVRVNDSTDWP